jgi:plasmid stabilization system protein ParE
LDTFELSLEAIHDIDAIWLYLMERDGLLPADHVVTELFKAFARIADMPNAVHRRRYLTFEDVLFRRIVSYLAIYQRGSNPLQIVAVLHAKRDVARILTQ